VHDAQSLAQVPKILTQIPMEGTAMITEQCPSAQMPQMPKASYPRKSVPRVDIGVLSIDSYTQTALVEETLEHALHGGSPRQIVTVNAQFYVLAHKYTRFRDCLKKADYICADGMPIVWVCNTFGRGEVPRIAGVDLIQRLCELGAPHGLRVFFLGGRAEAANTTARLLSQRYPGLKVAGVNCPEFGFERQSESLQPVLDHIVESKPQILFVGLGAPKQELFIHDHIRRLNVPLAVGIGGSFEILAGIIDRAPVWMQSCGFEWAFRLWQEPKRLWKRYLVGNLEFVWIVAKWRLRSSLRVSTVGFSAPGA
jgi:N-acetylglucosaminyldiphosphoundecaprenol N-acetyl-beta-D-mannosaminyltransferase